MVKDLVWYLCFCGPKFCESSGMGLVTLHPNICMDKEFDFSDASYIIRTDIIMVAKCICLVKSTSFCVSGKTCDSIVL